MSDGRFTINQSLIKQMYRKGDEIDHCPMRLKAQYIDKSVKYDTLTFQRGRYFEYLAIGAGASDDDVITDLPRKQNGDKKIDQIRIEEQAMRFKSLLPVYGMDIQEVQKVVKVPWEFDERVTLRIVIDYTSPVRYRMGPIVYDYDLAIVDLKLTQNIYNKFGDYSWGFPQNMDHLQAKLYAYVWEQYTGDKIPFFYWIFDYKKNPQMKIIRKKPNDPLDLAEMHELIRKSYANLYYYEQQGWPANPTTELCQKCPLADVCEASMGAADNVTEI